MTSTNPGVNAIVGVLADLRAERQQLERDLKFLDDKIEAVQLTLSLVRQNLGVDTQPEFRPGPIDFKGANNHDERLKRIAAAGDGTVNATQAAIILIEAGLAKGKKRNLVSSMYRAMGNSDDWELVSPGTFKLNMVQTFSEPSRKIRLLPNFDNEDSSQQHGHDEVEQPDIVVGSPLP